MHHPNSINSPGDSVCSIDAPTISPFHRQIQLTAAVNGLISLSSSLRHPQSADLDFSPIDSLLMNNEGNSDECHSDLPDHDGTTSTTNGNTSLLCCVCQDRASGRHYGVLSCEVLIH